VFICARKHTGRLILVRCICRHEGLPIECACIVGPMWDVEAAPCPGPLVLDYCSFMCGCCSWIMKMHWSHELLRGKVSAIGWATWNSLSGEADPLEGQDRTVSCDCLDGSVNVGVMNRCDVSNLTVPCRTFAGVWWRVGGCEPLLFRL